MLSLPQFWVRGPFLRIIFGVPFARCWVHCAGFIISFAALVGILSMLGRVDEGMACPHVSVHDLFGQGIVLDLSFMSHIF